ncbi:transmembrane gamma-carboxyglutamic acid protein 2 [Bombina bombina]|uniref:transmembrane gamma-carboxyglutamic acid protein 2 n=1 Tax=Bombina bombina TaxID=8345 RepID=UPI00235B1820|nr:transmembrane gamma-carboxyglutamic acid protein 2 [Bombina bombina]
MVLDMIWTGCVLVLIQTFTVTIGHILEPQRLLELRKTERKVFLANEAAHQFFTRKLLYNSWDFEMFTKGNLERECNEEVCNYEEARECFEDEKKTQEFWNTYPHNGKGGGSGSSPTVDIAGMVAGIVAGLVLLVMAAAVIMYCVRYRAKERRRGRAPVNLTSLAPPSEDLPLTQLPVLEVTAPGLPSYEEALEASGTYDAPPPPYQRGSTRSSQPS